MKLICIHGVTDKLRRGWHLEWLDDWGVDCIDGLGFTWAHLIPPLPKMHGLKRIVWSRLQDALVWSEIKANVVRNLDAFVMTHVAKDEPVVLAGFSWGTIVAMDWLRMGLKSHDTNVIGVVTMGSPLGNLGHRRWPRDFPLGSINLRGFLDPISTRLAWEGNLDRLAISRPLWRVHTGIPKSSAAREAIRQMLHGGLRNGDAGK